MNIFWKEMINLNIINCYKQIIFSARYLYYILEHNYNNFVWCKVDLSLRGGLILFFSLESGQEIVG